MSERWKDYPPALSGSQKEGGAFRRQDDYYAVHGDAGAAGADEALFQLADGKVSVHRGAPATGVRPGRQIGPVYARPDGPLAVPTGNLFVRFREGSSAEEHREAIGRAGYEIVKVPGYAPHAVWVRARSNDMATALRGMPALAALPGVEHVEPEMLTVRAKR